MSLKQRFIITCKDEYSVSAQRQYDRKFHVYVSDKQEGQGNEVELVLSEDAMYALQKSIDTAVQYG